MYTKETIALVAEYAAVQGGHFSKKDVGLFFEALSGALQAAFRDGGVDSITLPGVGKLKIKTTTAREGVNPKTRERVKIPARRKASLMLEKPLRDALNS